jgi:hypothetical protein
MAFKDANPSQLAAASRLQLEELAPLLGLLEAELRQTQERLLVATEVPLMYRLQGKASAFKDVLDLARDAGDRLHRARTLTGKP